MALVQMADEELPLAEHLEELRRRLIFSLIALAVGTIAIWGFSRGFLAWLAEPVGGLIFTAPTEAFFTRLKVAMFGGFLVALPVILFQAWSFTARALPSEMRRGVIYIIPVSFLLFVGGVALAIVVVVPSAIGFLLSYGSEQVKPMLTVGQYLDFVSMLSLAFGCVFQIPLVLMFLYRAGVVTRVGLTEKRPYIYFAGFVAAAMLTPGPDVFSQMALALPIIILFELSLLAMRWSSSE
jgi:sec-independent protein translocase protein TatC